MRKLAFLASVAMLVVVLASAFIRLSQSGLDCPAWLLCAPETGAVAGQSAEGGIDLLPQARQAHRVAASLVLLLALGLALLAWRQRARQPDALALLLLTLGLAALGVISRGATAAPIVLGNLLGGFAVLALGVRLASRQRARDPRLRGWAIAALLVAVLQAAAGGLISVHAAVTACSGLGECSQLLLQGGPQAPAAVLQLMHRLLALVLLVLVLPLAWKCWRLRRPVSALGLAGLMGLQWLLGTALAAPSLALALGHSLGAALLIALLAALP